jgi:LmbE family N-acetylglucosaminyl deacetylase
MILGACVALASMLGGPTGDEHGVVALRQALLDVTTNRRLLAVAAHPDDEDLATLVVERRRDGVRTAVALGTRGEGGQDEIGPELYRSLGVVRTREMEEAAAIHGARIRYLDLPDFGFSKTSEETLGVWGKDEAIRRLVRIVRDFRPHVMISNHDTKSGHGNHQVMGAAMLDAFDRAADPAFAPELGPAWSVAKCYVRSPRDRADVVVRARERDPVRGVTFFDLAAEALRHHRSQGTWDTLIGSEDGVRSYELMRTRVGKARESGLFDRVPSTSDELRSAGASREATAVDELVAEFRAVAIPSRPDDLAPWIAERLGRARALAARASGEPAARLASFAGRVENALVCALGAELDVDVVPEVSVPGEPIGVRARFSTLREVEWRGATLDGPIAGATIAAPLVGAAGDVRFAGRLDSGVHATRPAEEHLYDADADRPAIAVDARFRFDGEEIALRERTLLDVSTPIEIDVSPRRVLGRAGAPALVSVRLQNRLERPWRGTLRVGGRDVKAVSLRARADAAETIEIGDAPASRETRIVDVVADGSDHPIAQASVDVKACSVVVAPGLRVGVVETYDRTASDTLRALGVEYRPLEAADLATGDLRSLDTIVVDLRGYGVRPDLRENAQRLVEWVRAGGHLVVFYQKTGDWKPEYAPLPLAISGDRVTVETAPVQILRPEHPLLSLPNRVYPESFDGWVQERGLYFPKEYDRGYEELLAMADPGEKPLRGGLLFCRAGKGSYVYTSLVWYRQWRELQEGALAVFANLVSYPRYREP